jgi:succinyl-CoA synthetase alpha subunit
VIAGGKGTAADKYRALDKSGARTVKSPADLGKAMAEELARRRAKPLKKATGPNVLIIEPKRKSTAKKQAPKKKKKAARRGK